MEFASQKMLSRVKARNFSCTLPAFLALVLVWFTATSFVGSRAPFSQRCRLHRRPAAEASSAMTDTASKKDEAAFPKAFVFLSVLNVPLALAGWPALAVAMPLTALLARASVQKPDGRQFEEAIEQSSLDSLTITSQSNRLIRASLGALHLLVGVRCAAACAKNSLLWSGVNLLQVTAVFVIGGMWLSTATYGQ
eukprot:TRINITY_DN77130_c0_g1_i1.p1 TRINITY_DN77130_c0_g1~~TRINITY_DN77130_c0_g1_i1.p1  ORF type:complete len:203 (+),score=16.53 TRINITY_DN77130_c0_g1_i1:28-609(+)